MLRKITKSISSVRLMAVIKSFNLIQLLKVHLFNAIFVANGFVLNVGSLMSILPVKSGSKNWQKDSLVNLDIKSVSVAVFYRSSNVRRQ